MSLFSRTSSSSEVNPAEAAAALATGDGILIDVRESNEWAGGRAAPARHVPLGQLHSRLASLPRDQPIYVICESGSRSSLACELLRRAGFSQPINVRGGTNAWLRSGLPIVR